MNREKEMCLPDKEYISCHLSEKTNMSAKCKMAINCSKNFMTVKTKMTAE